MKFTLNRAWFDLSRSKRFAVKSPWLSFVINAPCGLFSTLLMLQLQQSQARLEDSSNETQKYNPKWWVCAFINLIVRIIGVGYVKFNCSFPSKKKKHEEENWSWLSTSATALYSSLWELIYFNMQVYKPVSTQRNSAQTWQSDQPTVSTIYPSYLCRATIVAGRVVTTCSWALQPITECSDLVMLC